jgi:hypothetical protein
MITVVASLLEKAQGPMALRASLRAKSKPLRALLRSLGTLKTVRAEMPEMLLGGNLIALMSEQMRALLAEGERQPGVAVPSHKRSPKFTDRTGAAILPEQYFPLSSSSEKKRAAGLDDGASALTGRSNTAILPEQYFPLSPFSEKKRAAGMDNGASTFEEGIPFSDLPDLSHGVAPGERISQPPFWPSTRSEFQTAPPTESSRLLFAPLSDSTKPGRSKDGSSLLAEKLREYWELGKTEHEMKHEPGFVIGEPAPAEMPAALQPQLRPDVRTRQSWPEATARQLAHKVRSLGAETASSSSLQTINSGSAGKVEVQNVFHIEVKAESNPSADFTEDLAEQLSCILREQALQHGIDVT